ncbi:MAG TPA: PASTA domain-containing protein [Pyrinomonadaceae bacterium]|jgi:beta-lactam-binding protein with PASTA domain/lipopolysaccharide biosynthesis regulator YciM|nr:PASTA domain-containing protein [Pyrinomonadaceae bacterium]
MNPLLKMVLSRARIVLCLLLCLYLIAPGAPSETSAPQNSITGPAALVKNIVVGGQSQTDANINQAVVKRADGGASVPVSNGLLLYRGDLIDTFANTKLTILFLDDPVSERDNEVIIDAESRVAVSSTYSWWGTIWAKVKGAFDSRTDYVRLGAKGTEYEFKVFKGEQRSTLIVLEGGVEVKKGSFPTVGRWASPAPEAAMVAAGVEDRAAASNSSLPAAASLAHALSAQEQFGRQLAVQGGKITDFDFTYHVSNDCGQAHHFEFRATSDRDWLRLEVESSVTVMPGETHPVNTVLKIDATRLAPGQYLGRIYALCTDCTSERRRCIEGQLAWPIKLTVTSSPITDPTPTQTTTPITTPTSIPTQTPTPTLSPQDSFTVRELEESTLTRGADRVEPAPVNQVLSVLSWTNNVILPAQPTYPAQNLIPHFASVEQRSQSFTSARQSAILDRNVSGSNKILGDVYNDWGAGAQAVRAYEKESSLNSTRLAEAVFAADLAEAYRLTGQLEKAQVTLERTGVDQRATPILNARGNLSLDTADIALDRRDANRAREQLAKAQAYYQAALQGPQTTQSAGARRSGGQADSARTIQTNLGEAYLANGQIALREGDLQEARSRYESSAQLLNSVQQANPQYPFAITDLGRAYQGLGNVARFENRPDEARRAYVRAESQHRQAIALHPDMAEAYFNLGDLYEDEGNPAFAKESYQRAIKARPEQPDSYYPLALLIQRGNPQLAAALAAVYLKLLPPVFRQGEKARNAERIRRGEPVTPPVRPLGPAGGIDVAVPNVINMTRDEAVKALRDAGFVVGDVTKQGGANAPDTVIEQRPIAGFKARRESRVNLVLGGPVPEDRVVVDDRVVKVPDVRNDKLETARRKITERGLTVGRVDEQRSCESVGKVLEQTPKGGIKVPVRSPVNLTVRSVGDDARAVPSVVGSFRDEAERIIREAGLGLDRPRQEETDRVRPGTVLRQEPDPGTQLAKGCAVRLTLAIPIPDVEVDNYVGMTERQARFLVTFKGLDPAVIHQVDEGPAGKVIAQRPTSGTRVRKGSVVTLTVSTREPQRPDGNRNPPEQERPVNVPNVMNKLKSDAENIIRRAGLVPQVQAPRGVNCDETSCHVYEQEPLADTPARRGTVVIVRVKPPVIY